MSNILREKEIDALIKKGIYKDKDSLYSDALRLLFIYRPELKIESAIEMYTSGEVSLSKASEIANFDTESFKEELKRRGIKIEITSPDKDVLDAGVSAILEKQR